MNDDETLDLFGGAPIGVDPNLWDANTGPVEAPPRPTPLPPPEADTGPDPYDPSGDALRTPLVPEGGTFVVESGVLDADALAGVEEEIVREPPTPVETGPEEGVAWAGSDLLRYSLMALDDLTGLPEDGPGDHERIVAALREYGQLRPVLLDADGRTVVGRPHLALAARALGWTHVATRLAVAEDADGGADQMSFIAEVEKIDPSAVGAFARKPGWREADEAEIDGINETSADTTMEWVGLPEFVRADDALKVVVSCDTEADRDALFDALGISTIHKGTRGTLSVWWPDRPKKELSALRFVVEKEKS